MPRQPARLPVRLCFFVLVSLRASGSMPEYLKLIFVPPSFVLTGYPTIHRITIKPKARSHTSADPARSPQHMSKCAGSGLDCRRIFLAMAVWLQGAGILPHAFYRLCSQQSWIAFHHRYDGSLQFRSSCMCPPLFLLFDHM